MSETIKILWSFIKRLLKKWIIWLSLVFFVIGVLFKFVLHIEEIPSYIFWILAFVGLFWASFRVYIEQQKNSGVLVEGKPEISITLLEGNEYKYSLSESAFYREKVGADYLTPDASIELHFRILNKGTIDMDIISINADYEEYDLPWQFYPPDKLKEKGNELCFPKHLNVNDILLCDINNNISVRSILNDAQFAARLVKINKKSTCIKGKVIVESRDSTGKIRKFFLSFDVALRPLMDLYINKWQENKQANLLRLARLAGITKKEITPKRNTTVKK